MTDPTADAIAALEPFAKAADEAGIVGVEIASVYGNDATVISVDDLRRAREVRSALLSAQGQAGKPVAWMRPIAGAAPDFSSFDLGPQYIPLYAQPLPAAGLTDALTTARTALEAAEKAREILEAAIEAPYSLSHDFIRDALTALKGERL